MKSALPRAFSLGVLALLVHCVQAVPVAWGSNGNGQLGTGNTVNSAVPVTIPSSGSLTGKTVTALSAGGDHTLALASDGTVHAWGYNGNGQLGNGTNTNSNLPMAVDMAGVLTGKTVTAISAGGNHSVALTSEGKVYAWGANYEGGLGNNSLLFNIWVPVEVTTTGVLDGKTVKAIAAGYLSTAAITADGQAVTWGYNQHGMLGTGSTAQNSRVPVAVNTEGVLNGKVVTGIAVGSSHMVAVTADGLAFSWGDNGDFGKLGNGDGQPGLYHGSSVPVAVLSNGALNGKTVTKVAAAYGHSLVLTSDGLVFSWGQNFSRQLGNIADIDLGNPIYGAGAGSPVPVAVITSGVLAGKVVISISAGADGSIALTSDGQVVTWGSSSNGQLGNNSAGSGLPFPEPVAVFNADALSGLAVTAISAGFGHRVVMAVPIAANSPTITLTAGVPSLRFLAVPHTNYQLQRSLDGMVTWPNLAVLNSGPSGLIDWTETENPLPSKAFYRFVLP